LQQAPHLAVSGDSGGRNRSNTDLAFVAKEIRWRSHRRSASLFVEEGAQVVVVGRDEGRLDSTVDRLGDQASGIKADLSTESGTRSLAEQVASFHSGIDVLVANAGASNAPELWETTDADFDRVIGANLKSAFFTVASCRPLLRDRASVILVSSVASGRGRLGDPLYAAAKAAVRTLGRGFAADEEFLRRGIRVNAASFGAVRTPMTWASVDPEDLQAWAEQEIPFRRWANVNEAAEPILFLAGAGSTYMTGTEVAVDGGLAQI
jgi:NAD(P)-dependent dehydrogenase (short-subunit alcohol dehydrogenase family)